MKKKLDKYDTQILLLSKCHFDEDIKGDRFSGQNLNRIDALKAIWSWRCAVDIKCVNEGTILLHLIKMLEYLEELNANSVSELLSFAVSYPRENWKLGTNRKDLSMLETLIYGALGKLSSLPVRNTFREREEVVYEDLIELEEKDNRFLRVFEKQED